MLTFLDVDFAPLKQVLAFLPLKYQDSHRTVVDPRCFKWKMLSLTGPNALLFLQFLLVLITRSAVNV